MTSQMTAARFNELQNGAEIRPDEVEEYARLLKWKRRADGARHAVAVKRKRYDKWPTRSMTHKRITQ